jgi:hypothetical protein
LKAKGFDEKLQRAIKVTRVVDGAEPTEFKALFNRWVNQNDQKRLGKACSSNHIKNFKII